MPSKHKTDDTKSLARTAGEDEYLTPDQRLKVVTDILSDIALRILNESSHDN